MVSNPSKHISKIHASWNGIVVSICRIIFHTHKTRAMKTELHEIEMELREMKTKLRIFEPLEP